MQRTIIRTERVMITGQLDPIDVQKFDNETDAEKFLRANVPALNDAHYAEIWAESHTSFENREMVNRGHSAYLARVVYEISAV